MGKIILTEQFPGYFAKRDGTQLPPGALVSGSQNVGINDDDTVENRSGLSLEGTTSSATTPIKSMYVFKKKDGTQVFMRTYGTVVEYKHPDLLTWENLLDSQESGKIYGFATHSVNTSFTSKVYFCNGVNEYTEWTGEYTQLNGALAGGETTIPVDTTLQPFVFFSGTASSVTTTTITMPAGTWATDLWTGTVDNRFLVVITSGAQSGFVSEITATTATSITFTAISGLSGTPTFEIRRPKFKLTGTLRIGTSNVTYTGITSTSFTGAGGTPVALDNSAVTQGTDVYKSAPRGNILLVEKTRMYVANVEKSKSSLYYSKIANATDFSFSATRLATEGGVIDFPEGGGAITGLASSQDGNTILVIKPDIVKTVSFVQDTTDIPVIGTSADAPDVGANHHNGVFRMDNQVIYTSGGKAIKVISDVENMTRTQTIHLSDAIKKLTDTLDFTEPAGVFYKQRAYIACRTSDATFNDTVLVFNFQKNTWEAPIVGWRASCFAIYEGDLYFGSSINPVIYKLEDDIFSDNSFPYTCVATFAPWNFGEPTLLKEIPMGFLEGFISENTPITIELLYNHNGVQEVRSTTLSGSESDFIVATADYNALGLDPLGINPLAGTLSVPEDINRFRLYFTTTAQPCYEIQLRISSSEAGARWKILRYGFDATALGTEQISLHKKLI